VPELGGGAGVGRLCGAACGRLVRCCPGPPVETAFPGDDAWVVGGRTLGDVALRGAAVAAGDCMGTEVEELPVGAFDRRVSDDGRPLEPLLLAGGGVSGALSPQPEQYGSLS
jgi:hypothetical protein